MSNFFVTRYRRTSFGVANNPCGSMTVEAAFVVPFFIFCLVNLLFGIQVVETSSRITAAMHETGNEICSYGYAYENSCGEGVGAEVGSTIYAASSIAKHLGNVTDKRGGIKGGIPGISYLGSSIMSGNGIVKIVATYSIKYPVNVGAKSIRLGTTYYGHAWVGYDVLENISQEEAEDEIVYITPSGSVYHMSIDCSHLNPSVTGVDKATLENRRSNDGSKYYSCEICGSKESGNTVYITNYGNRYHSDLLCLGIKRNIQAVHLSEVGGRRVCMTCGY